MTIPHKPHHKPVRRSTKPLKRSGGLRAVGKSSRAKQRQAWHKELLADFATKGLDRCELCGGTFGLALAHSLKRRFITTRERYFEVALLDQKCHERIEHGGHAEMEAEIKRIIEGR